MQLYNADSFSIGTLRCHPESVSLYSNIIPLYIQTNVCAQRREILYLGLLPNLAPEILEMLVRHQLHLPRKRDLHPF